MSIHPGRVVLQIVSIGTAALLTACGSSTLMVITGTAAKGAPLAGSVEATCATGKGAATVESNGSYRVDVFDGQGPCLLKLTPTGGGTPLYSVTTGTGSNVVANITPLTNMFVQDFLLKLDGAAAGQSTPAAWFSLPAARSLLAQPTAVTNLVTNYFLPSLDTLPGVTVPSGLGAGILSSAFSATAGDPQDDFLEALSSGPSAVFDPITLSPLPAVSITLTTAAQEAPAIPAQTTGGSFTGGGN